MTYQPRALALGLSNYGDADFSLYLRRSFAKSMEYSGRSCRGRSRTCCISWSGSAKRVRGSAHHREHRHDHPGGADTTGNRSTY